MEMAESDVLSEKFLEVMWAALDISGWLYKVQRRMSSQWHIKLYPKSGIT